jgi:hypothetical protein
VNRAISAAAKGGGICERYMAVLPFLRRPGYTFPGIVGTAPVAAPSDLRPTLSQPFR